MRHQTGESKIGRKQSSGCKSLPINIIHLRNSCLPNFTPRVPGYLRTSSNVWGGVVVPRNTDLLRPKHSWGNVRCLAKEQSRMTMRQGNVLQNLRCRGVWKES